MDKIDPRMVKAKVNLLLRYPFWGSLACYLKVVEDPKVETMETDGDSLWYNPKFLNTLSEKQLDGVYAHEVSHIAYQHHTRRGKRDVRMWNEAGDYAINRDLLRAGFTLPEQALQDSRFDNMSAEQIFMVLQKEQDKQQQQGGQQPQQEQGNDPGCCGGVRDAAGEGNSAQMARSESEWRVRVMQAMAATNAKYAGDVPAEIKRMFESIRKPPQDWRALLRRFIDEKNRTDYSWSKPDRRYLGAGFVLPGLIPDGINKIGIVIDTSGSIDDRALGLFKNELQAIVDDGLTKSITVVCCDTTVKGRYDFQEGDRIDFKPKGGGGTAFSPAISWFAKNEPEVAALIYFTDLDCNDYGEEPWVPLMWLAHGSVNDIKVRQKKVPFGEVVSIVEELKL
jgi:predicted metal-dependent peptidase